MPVTPNIKRQLGQTADNLYINRWWSGEVTQRSPLFTPLSSMGLQIIARHDTLWSGCFDMDLSNDMTLVRRYGHSRFCSVAFGSSDYPLGYFSFKNIAGTIKLLVDTPTKVETFSSGALTSLYTKGTTTQSSFAKVGDYVYICDGTNLKKWDQTTVSTWGIAAPVTAPTLSFAAGSLSPTAGYTYVFVYKNSTSGHISSASPFSANTGPLTSQHIVVQGAHSSDTQVDKVDIYRTLDGGGVYYFLAEIANPAGTWSYTDNNADTALNTDLVAPLGGVNQPPPAGLDLVVYHNDRLFGAAGNLLYMSSGPDAVNGVQAECWNPAYVFTMPGKITGFASTPAGLIVGQSDDLWVVQGSDTTSYFPVRWQSNFGFQNQNCIVQDSGMIWAYTSRSQMWELSQMQEIGYSVGDQLLANFNPASSYLTLHRNGTDVGLYISDGTSKLKRYAVNFQAWAPTANIVGGCKAITSIETTTANWTMLVGRAAGSGYILQRDTTLYTDDGTAFTMGVTVGPLVVSPPGELTHVQFILTQLMNVGTYPTVSVLLDEIAANSNMGFVALPNPKNEPPVYDGTKYASTSYLSKRHFLKSAQMPLPEQVQIIQIQFTFVAENTRNEILGLAIQ